MSAKSNTYMFSLSQYSQRPRRHRLPLIQTKAVAKEEQAVQAVSRKLDLRNAQKQWPLLKISSVSGQLLINSRSSTDVLAEDANKYTAGFRASQAKLLQFLISAVLETEHRDAKFKYVRSVLGTDADFIGYLIISTLLAFTNTTLEDTLEHFLRKLNGAKFRAAIRVPVSAEHRTQAFEMLQPIVKEPKILQEPTETLLIPFLTDLVKVQDRKVKCWIRQADLMAETNPSLPS